MIIMTERNIALRVKHAGNGSRGRLPVLALLCGGLLLGVSTHAGAGPEGVPEKDKIFYNCSFSAAGLESILTIDTSNLNVPLIEGSGHLEASYILIYVRQNP